ncbi:MAG: PH domain-containing protein [Porcipelethomonas sp.]
MAKNDFEYVWTDKKRTIFGLPLSFTRYYLTEKKFITRVGLFSIVEDELDLYKVTDKKLVLKFGQRIFGGGTIILYVKDTDTPIKEIKFIKNPRKVSNLLDEYLTKERDRYRIRGRDMIGSMHEECNCDDGCDDFDD